MPFLSHQAHDILDPPIHASRRICCTSTHHYPFPPQPIPQHVTTHHAATLEWLTTFSQSGAFGCPPAELAELLSGRQVHVSPTLPTGPINTIAALSTSPDHTRSSSSPCPIGVLHIILSDVFVSTSLVAPSHSFCLDHLILSDCCISSSVPFLAAGPILSPPTFQPLPRSLAPAPFPPIAQPQPL